MVSPQAVRERLREEASRIRESVAPLAKPLTVAALIFFVAITSYWYWHIPSMGKAIGMLGAVAAVMALRGETHGSEKVIWMLIIFGLLYVEVRAINNDARDRQSERVAANKEFERITDGLTAVITQNQVAMEKNQQQFEKTMNGFGENSRMVTGGDSFCYLDISPLLDPNTVWLEVVKVGKYPIRGVTARIMDRNRYAQAMQRAMEAISKDHTPTSDEAIKAMQQAEAQTQDVRQSIPDFAKSRVPIGGYQLVGGDQQGIDILFRAFNGDWLERLELRRVNGKWARALLVETGQKAHPYFWLIDKNYPRVNGRLEVFWPRPVKGKPEWER